jgi:hypothetical protein
VCTITYSADVIDGKIVLRDDKIDMLLDHFDMANPFGKFKKGCGPNLLNYLERNLKMIHYSDSEKSTEEEYENLNTDSVPDFDQNSGSALGSEADPRNQASFARADQPSGSSLAGLIRFYPDGSCGFGGPRSRAAISAPPRPAERYGYRIYTQQPQARYTRVPGFSLQKGMADKDIADEVIRGLRFAVRHHTNGRANYDGANIDAKKATACGKKMLELGIQPAPWFYAVCSWVDLERTDGNYSYIPAECLLPPLRIMLLTSLFEKPKLLAWEAGDGPRLLNKIPVKDCPISQEIRMRWHESWDFNKGVPLLERLSNFPVDYQKMRIAEAMEGFHSPHWKAQDLTKFPISENEIIMGEAFTTSESPPPIEVPSEGQRKTLANFLAKL